MTSISVSVADFKAALGDVLPVLKRVRPEYLSTASVKIFGSHIVVTCTDRFVVQQTRIPFEGDTLTDSEVLSVDFDSLSRLKHFSGASTITFTMNDGGRVEASFTSKTGVEVFNTSFDMPPFEEKVDVSPFLNIIEDWRNVLYNPGVAPAIVPVNKVSHIKDVFVTTFGALAEKSSIPSVAFYGADYSDSCSNFDFTENARTRGVVSLVKQPEGR